MLVVVALAYPPAATLTGRNDAIHKAAAAGLNGTMPNDQHSSEQLTVHELMHEVELSRAAQTKLAAQLAEHVALVAQLQGQIDALRPPTPPPKTRTVSVAMTATSQQERRLSESELASCCRWTNSGACGSNVTYKWYAARTAPDALRTCERARPTPLTCVRDVTTPRAVPSSTSIWSPR